MKDLRQELKDLSFELDLIQTEYCSREEEKEFKKMKKNKIDLPSDVKESDNGSYFRYVKTDLSEDEIKNLFLYRQIRYLKTIKNSMLFFVVLTIISIILSMIALNR